MALPFPRSHSPAPSEPRPAGATLRFRGVPGGFFAARALRRLAQAAPTHRPAATPPSGHALGPLGRARVQGLPGEECSFARRTETHRKTSELFLSEDRVSQLGCSGEVAAGSRRGDKPTGNSCDVPSTSGSTGACRRGHWGPNVTAQT